MHAWAMTVIERRVTSEMSAAANSIIFRKLAKLGCWPVAHACQCRSTAHVRVLPFKRTTN
jgi:hypothetical protein